jgi:uncharacterized membrane protein YgcG
MEALLDLYGGDSSDEDDSNAQTNARRSDEDEESGDTEMNMMNSKKRKVEHDEQQQQQQAVVVQNEREHKSQSHKFQRSFPHTVGNFAGHIYVKLVLRKSSKKKSKNKEEEEAFKDESYPTAGWQEVSKIAIDEVLNAVKIHKKKEGKTIQTTATTTSSSSSGFHALPDYHVSLSRLFFLQHSALQSFEHSLTSEISFQCRKCTVIFNNSPSILTNDEHTRSFLTLHAVAGHGEVKKYIEVIDEVLQRYKQPKYYSEPIIHLSIASVPGCAVMNDEEDSCCGNEEMSSSSSNSSSNSGVSGGDEGEGGGGEKMIAFVEETFEATSFSIEVDEIECSLGQRVFRIPLRK